MAARSSVAYPLTDGEAMELSTLLTEAANAIVQAGTAGRRVAELEAWKEAALAEAEARWLRESCD
jgi:hypothetical protein